MEIPAGFVFYTGRIGLYGEDRDDLLVVHAPSGAAAAGVFTRNSLPAAPVQAAERLLACGGNFAGIVVNSGNANAATGEEGRVAVEAILQEVQSIFKEEYPFLPASTGIIGEPLPLDQFKKALHNLTQVKDLEAAARAIMTTDSFPKYGERTGEGYRIAACAKGAGMIKPQLATTLCFVFTDAALSAYQLRRALLRAAAVSFNVISVDGETSTNDCIILLSSRRAPVSRRAAAEFERLLADLLREMAFAVLRDGEGATRLIHIYGRGFVTRADAEKAVRAVGDSLLVKTAIYGADPNWGRIYAALGASGVRLRESNLRILLGETEVFRGGPVAFAEDEVRTYLTGKEVEITVDAGLGQGEAEYHTCDLTEEYIKINALYRT